MDNKDNFHGIPKNKIKWFPTIDYEKCLSCMACVGFCKNGVYAQEDGKPVVKNPLNCVVGCTGCDKICPTKAISHPSKEYLKSLVGNSSNYGSNCCSSKNCCSDNKK